MPVPASEPESTTAPLENGEVSPVAPDVGGDSDGEGGPGSPSEQLNGQASDSSSPREESEEEGEEEEGKPCKMFIGGLSWQTSEDKLTEFFTQFGEVAECSIMKDPGSKRSRGFGFITFKCPECVDKVLESHMEEAIYIDDKAIDPKIAVPPKRLSNRVKRIFVGGLSSDSNEDDLRDYFEQFGRVLESQLMYDRNTNRHRGFGFVTFEAEEPAEKVCSIQYHDIKGKKVEVKVAQTKEALAMQGRGRGVAPRTYTNYSYSPAQSYAPFYPHTHYPIDMLMGSYGTPQVIMGNTAGGGKLRGKGRNYSQYPTPMFGYSPGYMDHRRMNNMATYFPPGYGGMLPPHMLRGHPSVDPALLHSSGMEYMSDQFQGMALNAGGYPTHSYGNEPPSPAGQYGAMNHTLDPVSGGSYGNGGPYPSSGGSSYSPTHSLSPKGSGSSAINGFTSQVPIYSGTHSSYAIAQQSY